MKILIVLSIKQFIGEKVIKNKNINSQAKIDKNKYDYPIFTFFGCLSFTFLQAQ